jgi:hypothetical protein
LRRNDWIGITRIKHSEMQITHISQLKITFNEDVDRNNQLVDLRTFNWNTQLVDDWLINSSSTGQSKIIIYFSYTANINSIVLFSRLLSPMNMTIPEPSGAAATAVLLGETIFPPKVGTADIESVSGLGE